MKKSDLLFYINNAIDDALRNCRSENPLEAWADFINILDCRVRKQIGDDLEANGRNRYTGK
jgi:hypothetical protein